MLNDVRSLSEVFPNWTKRFFQGLYAARRKYAARPSSDFDLEVIKIHSFSNANGNLQHKREQCKECVVSTNSFNASPNSMKGGKSYHVWKLYSTHMNIHMWVHTIVRAHLRYKYELRSLCLFGKLWKIVENCICTRSRMYNALLYIVEWKLGKEFINNSNHFPTFIQFVFSL